MGFLQLVVRRRHLVESGAHVRELSASVLHLPLKRDHGLLLWRRVGSHRCFSNSHEASLQMQLV